MTVHTQPPEALYPPGLMTQLGTSARGTNWRRNLLAWIGCLQLIYAVSIILTSSGRGVSGLLQRDTGLPTGFLSVLFLFGAGHYLRGLRPRYSLLTSLIGQGLYAIAAIAYAVRGEIDITVASAHSGIFVMCVLAVIAISQRMQGVRRQYQVHSLLMPAMSFALLGYTVGLVLQPGSGTAGWILRQFGNNPYAIVPYGVLTFWFAVGSGFIFHNHIKSRGLYLALLSQYVYALASLGYLISTPNVPILGIVAHLAFSITSGIVILIQNQDQ